MGAKTARQRSWFALAMVSLINAESVAVPRGVKTQLVVPVLAWLQLRDVLPGLSVCVMERVLLHRLIDSLFWADFLISRLDNLTASHLSSFCISVSFEISSIPDSLLTVI